MQAKNLDLLDLIERISEDVNSILELAADSSQANNKIKENPMPDYERTSSPVPPPEQGEPKGGCGFAQVKTIKFGQAELKPYEETQEAKLELISTLIALADTTGDHSTAIMLRIAVKRILQRDFKIDFDSGAQEEKPHIPQPRDVQPS